VHGLSDADVVHKVMCQALEYKWQLSKLHLKMRRNDATLGNGLGKLVAIVPGRRELPLDSRFQG
jgi:hypothetical protein